MASGHVNRIKRPNTWLHRPILQNVKKALANPGPSTHGTERTWPTPAVDVRFRGNSGSRASGPSGQLLTYNGHCQTVHNCADLRLLGGIHAV